jgi:transcriptional regulator with XRE-family HTH domain
VTVLRSSEEVLRQQLRDDPEFRAHWQRTALARAVALRVVGYRIERGLTQTALARQLGMRQSAIARLEAGEHTPSVETLLRLSRSLGMEFLLHVTPGEGTARWQDPPEDDVTVRERVQGDHGAVLAAAC